MASHHGVTVVIPTYNRSDLVGEAINSVLAQDWPETEVLVVDDGSTDRTPEVLAGYGDRVRVIRQENAGESAARNTGILAASHELVAFLDSDNYWLPGKLGLQMQLFSHDEPPDVAFSAYTRIGDVPEEDVVLSEWAGTQEDALEQLLIGCRINTSTVIVRRNALIDVGLYDSSLRCAQDYDLWLRLAVAGYHIAYVPRPLAAYRIHGGAVSLDSELVNASTERVVERLFDNDLLPAEFQERRDFYLARCYLNSACFYLDTGAGREAADSIAKAARTRPASIRPGWFLIWVRGRRLAAASGRAMRAHGSASGI
ncbi:MAG TPA: glycosyltransferase [Thermoleophilaceae bacterium]|jgi:glycosyltransferase involved in cell wall biosynthesis|nr:glycosyltransferase [Thermoleophilaceae bacterium]